jgi:hypothetical protein
MPVGREGELCEAAEDVPLFIEKHKIIRPVIYPGHFTWR